MILSQGLWGQEKMTGPRLVAKVLLNWAQVPPNTFLLPSVLNVPYLERFWERIPQHSMYVHVCACMCVCIYIETIASSIPNYLAFLGTGMREHQEVCVNNHKRTQLWEWPEEPLLAPQRTWFIDAKKQANTDQWAISTLAQSCFGEKVLVTDLAESFTTRKSTGCVS